MPEVPATTRSATAPAGSGGGPAPGLSPSGSGGPDQGTGGEGGRGDDGRRKARSRPRPRRLRQPLGKKALPPAGPRPAQSAPALRHIAYYCDLLHAHGGYEWNIEHYPSLIPEERELVRAEMKNTDKIRVAQQTVYHDAERPSHILLPVIPPR